MVILNCDTTWPFLEMGNRPNCKLAICAHPREQPSVVILNYDTTWRILGMGNRPVCNLAFSGMNKKNQKWLPHPCLLRGLKGGENGK